MLVVCLAHFSLTLSWSNRIPNRIGPLLRPRCPPSLLFPNLKISFFPTGGCDVGDFKDGGCRVGPTDPPGSAGSLEAQEGHGCEPAAPGPCICEEAVSWAQWCMTTEGSERRERERGDTGPDNCQVSFISSWGPRLYRSACVPYTATVKCKAAGQSWCSWRLKIGLQLPT